MAAQAYLYGGMAALELIGGYFASQNIKETARINREIAEMNAEFAELDAYDAELEGYTVQARYQSVIDNTLSEQQLAMTAQGVDVNYGSAAVLQEETRFIGELNKMEIEKRAQEQALGIKRQARDTRFSANLQFGQEQARAAQAMFGSVMGAAKSGATGYQRSR
jgi:hypothetical protein